MPGEEGGMGFERPASGGGTPGVDIQKVVYVDATGVEGITCDYTTIAAAAAYLKGLVGKYGGFIGLRGGQNHIVNTVVDLTGITVFSARDGQSIIQAQSGGVLRVSGTHFERCTFLIPAAFAGSYLLQLYEQGYTEFKDCDFQNDNTTPKFVIGGGNKFNVGLVFERCSQTVQPAAGVAINSILDPAALVAATIRVFGFRGAGLNQQLQFDSWAVETTSDGRIETSGQIDGMPPGTLYVAPGESIQARLDSLTQGGKVIILPGIHYVQNKVLVQNDSIQIEGAGDASIIRAMGAADPTHPWLGTELITDAVIEVGAANGSAPVNDCHIHDIRVQVAPNIHGIKVNGGNNNDVSENTVESTVLKTNARTGIVFTDSQSNPSYGPKTTKNTVRGWNIGTGQEDAALRFIDCIHMDGDAPFVGATFGYGNYIYDAICQGNIVKFASETGYVFTAVFNGSIFVNRSRTVCYQVYAIGLAMLYCEECDIVSGSIVDNQTLNADGIYLYECINCIVDDVTIDGGGNNFSPAIQFISNTTRCTTKNNNIKNAGNGIILDNTCSQNEITPNNFIGVTTPIVDNSASTKYQGRSIVGTGNPNGVVTGFFSDVFHDRTGNILYLCTSFPTGTTWKVI